MGMGDGDWLRRADWLGNTPLSWFGVVVGAILGFAVVWTVLRWLRGRIDRRLQHGDDAGAPSGGAAQRGGTALHSIAAALGGVRRWLLAALSIAIPLNFLTFRPSAEYWLHLITVALVGLQVVLCVNRVIVTVLLRTAGPPPPAPPPVMLGILTWACQFVVWVTFLLALLTAAGVNITAFVASLGIGGIAVALALQNILGDLFASVAIGLDKPFEPGESISFGEGSGTVQRVGVKTTRIESTSGEQLAISNSKLLGLVIHNNSRMTERRVVLAFGVPYDTPREVLGEIVQRVGAIIAEAEPVRFDRGHFTGFGPDGFTFEFAYHVLDPDYTTYLDIQQQIGERVVEALDSLGVRLAVPARAVTVAGSAGTR